ncbi:MAG TPA: primosomal protein N' [Steroidobacteraceae bacterium]|jgi:primosomal protein N' (replication factor Y)|nr:primosomal protein N' [Steroidobacteraceae bacterium]
MILQIALNTPLRRVFDYRPPAGSSSAAPRLGVRVRVPFGRQQLIGILVGVASESAVAAPKLKTAVDILDEDPIVDPVTFDLLRWAAEYYHHPLGEVFAAGLPVSLREGQPALQTTEWWSLSETGRQELSNPSSRRAPQQRALLAWFKDRGRATAEDVGEAFKPAQLRALAARGWIASQAVAPDHAAMEQRQSDVELNSAQALAVGAILASLSTFAAHLLYGVTGSGKTEVYLRVIAAAIADGGQALVLVPEIALTPQLVDRFRRRFSSGVVAMHSGLTNIERRDAWRAAHTGQAKIIIGTRSAVFTSLPRLALIVVDEEHDASYKQHEGFRYSARDLAVIRARGVGIPIVLGSATPSLETLENAATGRYLKHLLPQRPGAAQAPRIRLVDLRKHASDQGLSTPAMLAMAQHLKAGGQVIVFLNRRGYAPCLFCNSCGWVAPCAHCDARMTLHRRAQQLRCHHCGAHSAVPNICASCGQALNPVGQGTERVEETLSRLFPQAPLARLDRDTASARGALQTVLDRVHRGEARILVGTQMLTKGHHFPEVSLVVILDADQGLFASDFRATERLAQTITQVAGRAGRGLLAGEVIIQTEFPEHPLLNRLITEGYEGFAAAALEERREAGWPPFSRLAMLRAEAKDGAGLDAFLQAAATSSRSLHETAVKVLGPASALIARRADHFRAHLLIETAARSTLQRFLKGWLPQVEKLSGPAGLRWSIDVDPLEVD